MNLFMIEAGDVWLAAMNQGYISGNTPQIVPDQNFAKQFRFERGPFLVVDRWHSRADTNHSGGETLIYHNGVPVWYMSYYGWYDARATPFLKEALTESYRNQQKFIGGRGPVFFQRSSLAYNNTVHFNSNFEEFSGREEIIDGSSRECLGYHRYMGGRI